MSDLQSGRSRCSSKSGWGESTASIALLCRYSVDVLGRRSPGRKSTCRFLSVTSGNRVGFIGEHRVHYSIVVMVAKQAACSNTQVNRLQFAESYRDWSHLRSDCSFQVMTSESESSSMARSKRVERPRRHRSRSDSSPFQHCQADRAAQCSRLR